MTPVDVLACYRRVLTTHGLQPPRRVTPKAVRDATAFLRWCTARQVDPERYLRARHEALGWSRRIPLDRLGSEKFLLTFRQWGDQHQAHQVGQDRLTASMVESISHRVLSERMRRALPPDLCLSDPWTDYDPASGTCTGCPVRGVCAGSE